MTPESLEQEKKEFLSILSHELRNPLATILSSVELLRLQNFHPPAALALLETVEERVRSITNTLSGMLDLSGVHPSSAPLMGEVDIYASATTLYDARRGTKHTQKTVYSILVVDDNQMAADTLSILLKMSGHDVEVAYTGASAIQLARSVRPEVILLDIGLPDMDGYAVAHTLQEEKHFLAAFVALTGYGHAEDKKRALAAGFSAHLTKPVGLGDIEEVLQHLA